MSKKVYKSFRGDPVDMESLRIANEKATAVGNMGVNAKGDKLASGQIVSTAKERTADYYKDNPKSVKRVSLKPTLDQIEPVAESEQIEAPKKKVVKKVHEDDVPSAE